MGGAGSAVGEALAAAALVRPLLQLGLPDRNVEHGDQAQLLRAVGLDADGIERAVRERFPESIGLDSGPRLVASRAG